MRIKKKQLWYNLNGGGVVQTRNRLVDSRRQFVFRLHNLVEVATWTLLVIIFWKTALFKEFIFHAVYFFQGLCCPFES